MSSLRGGRAFTDLQVTGLQYHRGAIPAGSTEGYPLGVALDGKVQAVRDLAADSLDTLTLSTNGLTTGTLKVTNGMGVSGYSRYDGDVLIVGNLGVTGWITTIGPLIPAEGSTSFQGIHIFAGGYPAPMNGNYALDVSGASRFRGPIDISGGVTFSGKLDVSGGLNVLNGGYIQFVDGAGVTTGYVNADAAGLYLQSPLAVKFGKVAQAPPTMTLTMNTKTLELAGGVIETATVKNPAGTLTLGDAVQSAPVLVNGPVTVTRGIAMGAGTTLSLQGAIVNPAAGQPVTVSDNLQVTGNLQVTAITATGPVSANGGLNTTSFSATQSATFNSNVTISGTGTLTVASISGNASTIQISPNISVNASGPGTGDGTINAGHLYFGSSTSSIVETAGTQLKLRVAGATANIAMGVAGGNNLYITPYYSSNVNNIIANDSSITVPDGGLPGIYIGPQSGNGGFHVGANGSVNSYGALGTQNVNVTGTLNVNDDDGTIIGSWYRCGSGRVFSNGTTGITNTSVGLNSVILATVVGVTGYTVAVEPQVGHFFIKLDPAPPVGGVKVNWMIARI